MDRNESLSLLVDVMLQAIIIVLREKRSVAIIARHCKVILLFCHHSRCILIVHPLVIVFCHSWVYDMYGINKKHVESKVSLLLFLFVFRMREQMREVLKIIISPVVFLYYQFNSIPWGIMSGFLSILSALASLNRTPFWSDGDNVELIVMVLLIWLARVLSRRLELFKRTTKIIADNISKRAPKIPNRVPRNGLIWRKVGARAGEKSENGKTTECRGRGEKEKKSGKEMKMRKN